MSGGSYNYLCDSLNLYDLLTNRHNLQEMADDLTSLGYANDAAQETHELLASLNAADVRAGAAISRLSGVWKAKEWWRSCDWSEDQFREALAKYRGEATAPGAAYTLTPEEAAVVDALRAARKEAT